VNKEGLFDDPPDHLPGELAQPRVRQTTEDATVIFVIDRTPGVPSDPEPVRPGPDGSPIDRRRERIKTFVDEAVRPRGVDRRSDRASVTPFGRTPRLASPSAVVAQLPFGDRLTGQFDAGYANTAAASRLARAAFPERAGRRIVRAR